MSLCRDSRSRFEFKHSSMDLVMEMSSMMGSTQMPVLERNANMCVCEGGKWDSWRTSVSSLTGKGEERKMRQARRGEERKIRR